MLATLPITSKAINKQHKSTRKTMIQQLNPTQLIFHTLSHKLDDDLPQIRAKAAESLGKIGTEKALSYLLQSLTDQDPKVRAVAATVLGEIGTEATLAELSQACSDPDDEARLSAVDALGKIGYRYALN